MLKLKKLVVILATLVIAFTVSVTTLVASADELSVEEMREYLMDLQLPESYVDCLSNDEIIDFYSEFSQQTVTFAGSKEESFTFGAEVQTRGVIPADDLRFVMRSSVYYVGGEQDGFQPIDYVYIIIGYDWLNIPYPRGTDAAIVFWDPDVFTFKAGAFHATSRCLRGTSGQTYEYDNPMLIMQDSLGYEVKLDGVSSPTTLSGSCALNLIPKRNPTYRKHDYITSVSVQYRHTYEKMNTTVQLGTSGSSVTFATSEYTDTVATSFNLWYGYSW